MVEALIKREKNITFNFCCILRDKTTILTLKNARLFQTFDFVEIHTCTTSSQISFSVDAKFTLIFLTNQTKPYNINQLNDTCICFNIYDVKRKICLLVIILHLL